MCRQVISNNFVDSIGSTGPSGPLERIITTHTVSMLKKYAKWKYAFFDILLTL